MTTPVYLSYRVKNFKTWLATGALISFFCWIFVGQFWCSMIKASNESNKLKGVFFHALNVCYVFLLEQSSLPKC